LNNRVRNIHEQNAKSWNQTSDWYQERSELLIDHLRKGGITLHPQEDKLLSTLPQLDKWCELAIHLQCAAGFDTISLLNLGVKSTVGVDIASDLVSVASNTAGRLSVPATFICSDILDFTGYDNKADLVFTGKGALHWMFDIRAWADKVFSILKPGGYLLLFDFHPMMWLFRDGASGLELNPVSYFAPSITYDDWPIGQFGVDAVHSSKEAAIQKTIKPGPPSAIIQSLIQSGLEIKLFHEYPDSLIRDWTAYPKAADTDRARIATTFAIIAKKPEAK